VFAGALVRLRSASRVRSRLGLFHLGGDQRETLAEPPELTLLPAFFDIHEHLLDSARNLARVPLEEAHFGDDWLAL
jgi:hypothetical protein